MAIDVFNWCVQVQDGGGGMTTSNNVRSVSYGNGYQQRGSSGYNTVRREYTVTYAGADWIDVYDFLNQHLFTPFIFPAPDGRDGLFVTTADSVSTSVIGKNGLCSLSAKVTEVFSSVK